MLCVFMPCDIIFWSTILLLQEAIDILTTFFTSCVISKKSKNILDFLGVKNRVSFLYVILCPPCSVQAEAWDCLVKLRVARERCDRLFGRWCFGPQVHMNLLLKMHKKQIPNRKKFQKNSHVHPGILCSHTSFWEKETFYVACEKKYKNMSRK